MPSRKKMQNARISKQIRALHGALVDIFIVVNRPERDEVLIKEACIRLDRGPFPLFVGIERFGPIGVAELAGGVGEGVVGLAIPGCGMGGGAGSAQQIAGPQRDEATEAEQGGGSPFDRLVRPLSLGFVRFGR